jgi:hypothetical protein
MRKSWKFKKRSIRGEFAPLTPDVRAKGGKGVKLKKLPRGKAFAKGNQIGLRTRFQLGNRANVDGRPASKEISSALQIIASLELGQTVQVRTNAEATAVQLWHMGQEGSLAAIREILDRCEGKPATTLNVNDGRVDPFKELIESMTHRSKQIGPPDESGEDSSDDNDDGGRLFLEAGETDA